MVTSVMTLTLEAKNTLVRLQENSETGLTKL